MYMSTCIRPGARAMLLTIGIYHLLKLTHRRLGPAGIFPGVERGAREPPRISERVEEWFGKAAPWLVILGGLGGNLGLKCL